MQSQPTYSKLFGMRQYQIRLIILTVLFCFGLLFYLNLPSYTFPAGNVITVDSGESLSTLVKNLKDRHVIKSATLFQVIVVLMAAENKLIAGDYYFNRAVSTYTIASRITGGDFGLAPIRITIPEGLSMKQIASLLSGRFKNFSADDFMKFYPEKEGYLFPDTYFFISDIKAEGVITAMQKNFDEQIQTVENQMATSSRTEKDVITMASILEKEANNPTDWQIIAGILWKRLDEGMLLQVDSTLGLGPSYDTYVNKGLPAGPISNPGLNTIKAALSPTETKYFYYLSDKNGIIHYAQTFAEHLANKKKYLK